MADTTTDTNNTNILGSLGTANVSGTVSVDNNSVMVIIAGVAFVVILIFGGIFLLRVTRKKT